MAAVPSLNDMSFKKGSHGSFWREQCLIFKKEVALIENDSSELTFQHKMSHLSGARKALHAHIFLCVRTRDCLHSSSRQCAQCPF